jgi:hypothetical protein
MKRDEASPLEKPVRRHVWRSMALGAALTVGCATGVDVTDDELAAICSDPNNRCTGAAAGAGGASVGNTGGSGLTGGTFGSPTAGTGGTNTARGGSSNTGTGGSNTGSGGTGGSISGNGGTGGTTTPQPLAEGDCLAQSDITIGYEDRTAGSTLDNEPSMVLSVQNASGQPFSLGDLTIRYWFTADEASAFSGNIDYASLGGGNNGLQSSNVSVSFAQEFGSDYAELAFSSTAMVETGVEEIQLRFHGNPYVIMDQTNDFSYILNAAADTPNPNVAAYLSGVQVGGCVPIP